MRYFGLAVFAGIRLFTVIFWSALARLKLLLVWGQITDARSDGPILLPAIKGVADFGKNIHFGGQNRIGVMAGGVLSIGSNVSINQGTFILVHERVEIGDGCRIAEYVSIRDYDHKFDDPSVPILESGFISQSTKIGHNVWIGRGATIVKGVNVGDNSIIGANSVVTKDVDAGTVVAGVPAMIIKSR